MGTYVIDKLHQVDDEFNMGFPDSDQMTAVKHHESRLDQNVLVARGSDTHHLQHWKRHWVLALPSRDKGVTADSYTFMVVLTLTCSRYWYILFATSDLRPAQQMRHDTSYKCTHCEQLGSVNLERIHHEYNLRYRLIDKLAY